MTRVYDCPRESLELILNDFEPTCSEAVEADEGLLLPNRRWDSVVGNKDWFSDVQEFFKSPDFTYRDEFAKLFECDDSLVRLRYCTLRGAIPLTRFRSICWRLFLEVLPQQPTLWYGTLQEHRQHYAELKQRVLLKPEISTFIDFSNNYVPANSEAWSQYTKDKETRKLIKKDVERLQFSDETLQEFFSQKQTQKMLTNILFCCAKDNFKIGYYQGLHDILSVIVWTVRCDQIAWQNTDDSSQNFCKSISYLFNPDYLESDSYSIFFQLCLTLATWCELDDSASSVSSISQGSMVDGVTGREVRPTRRPSGCTTVMSKLCYIHSHLLHYFSPELHRHLSSIDPYPPVFAFRWLLVLFSRDLHNIDDVMRLWDGLFADGHDLDLLDYVFVAVLLYLKDELLKCEDVTYNYILTEVLPADFDMLRFIRDSRLLRNQFLNTMLLKSQNWEFVSTENVFADSSSDKSSGFVKLGANGELNPSGGTSTITWLSKIVSSPLRHIATRKHSEPLLPMSRAVKIRRPSSSCSSSAGISVDIDTEHLELETELSRCTKKIYDLEFNASQSCRGIDYWTGVLQAQLLKEALSPSDVKAAVCGLKEVSFHLKSSINRSSFCHLLEMDDAHNNFQSVIVRDLPLTCGLSAAFPEIPLDNKSDQSEPSDEDCQQM